MSVLNMVADPGAMKRVKTLLKFRPRGLTITDIAKQLHMNRNSVAKYLDMMVIAGEADVQEIGAARVFFLSQRVPLSALLSFTLDLVIIMNTDREIIQVNDTLCAFFGIPREALIDTALHESALPFAQDAALQAVPDGQEGVVEIACDWNKNDVFLKIKVIPTVFYDGNEGATLIIEDITGERRALQALRESEERYRMVVESQNELIARFLPDTTHIFVNKAYCNYFEKEREDLLGSRFTPRIPEEEQEDLSRHFSRLTPAHPVATIEHRIIMPDGKVRWQEWCDRAIFDEAGVLQEYQSVGRDSTWRKGEER